MTSCGGGGSSDGGSNNGNSGGSGSAGLTASVSSISYSANREAPLPTGQNFEIRWTSTNVAAVAIGVPAGQVVPTWLFLDAQGTGSPTLVLTGINSTDLSPDTYTSTVRIVASDSGGNVLDTVDVDVTYTVVDDFAVTETTMDFEAWADGRAPDAQEFLVLGADDPWTASVDQPWVSLSEYSGTTRTDIDVSVDPTGLAVGTHTATITVTNSDDPTETFDITVTFEALLPAVSTNPAILRFEGTNGIPIPFESIGFSLANGADATWEVNVSDPWITFEEISLSGDPTYAWVVPDPSVGPLASGFHEGEIEFTTTYQGQTVTETRRVTLDLSPPEFTVSPDTLSITGGPSADIAPEELALTLGPRTSQFSPQTWEVQASTNDGGAWVVTDGTGSIEEGEAEVRVYADTTGLTEASYSGSLEVTARVNGDVLTETIPVDMQMEPHRLFVLDNGVGFFHSPTLSKLSHTVLVSDNRRLDTPWTASSDQAWLSVTSSGTTDSDMILTADPTGLAADTIHYASVTVESSASSVTNSGQEIIKVGFYISSTAPAESLEIDNLAWYNQPAGQVLDPIRPYIYVMTATSDIDVVNVYTGAIERTISTTANQLATLAIATDGDTLYALDTGSQSIYSIDLQGTEPVVNSPWTDPAWETSSPYIPTFYYARINGLEALVGSSTDIIDATDGASLYSNRIGSSFIDDNWRGTFNPHQSILLRTDSNVIYRFILRYSELRDEPWLHYTGWERQILSNSFNGISMHPDGSEIYASCWYETLEVATYDGVDMTAINLVVEGRDGGSLYGPDGLLYCARYYSEAQAPGSPDIWSMDLDTMTIVKEFNVSGQTEARQFLVSGDGLRLVVRSNRRQTMTFLTIP